MKKGIRILSHLAAFIGCFLVADFIFGGPSLLSGATTTVTDVKAKAIIDPNLVQEWTDDNLTDNYGKVFHLKKAQQQRKVFLQTEDEDAHVEKGLSSDADVEKGLSSDASAYLQTQDDASSSSDLNPKNSDTSSSSESDVGGGRIRKKKPVKNMYQQEKATEKLLSESTIDPLEAISDDGTNDPLDSPLPAVKNTLKNSSSKKEKDLINAQVEKDLISELDDPYADNLKLEQAKKEVKKSAGLLASSKKPTPNDASDTLTKNELHGN